MAKCMPPFWISETDNATVRIVYNTIGIDRSGWIIRGPVWEPFASLSHLATGRPAVTFGVPNRALREMTASLGSEAAPEIFRSTRPFRSCLVDRVVGSRILSL
jgi:hypothetical protein